MRIAVYQGKPVQNGFKEAKRRLNDICVSARRRQANLLILPEMFLTGYNIGAGPIRAAAEPSGGPMITSVQTLATRYLLGIACGFAERADDGRVYNSVALIDARGTLRAVHRKTHLYGEVDRAQFSAGSALCPVLEFDGWRVALAICYDLEFPEVARAQARAGAEVILVPTANMHPYASVATRIVPARAQENGLFIAYANYIGSEGAFDYCGLSCVVGPDGEDLARAQQDEILGEELIVAGLSKSCLADVRVRNPYLADLRLDLYPCDQANDKANEQD